MLLQNINHTHILNIISVGTYRFYTARFVVFSAKKTYTTKTTH